MKMAVLMNAVHLKTARLKAGWSQHEAAARLGVSQPYYCQMESGARPVPGSLVRRAVRRLQVSPVALPLPPLSPQPVPVEPKELASAVGRLGYAGFAHLGKGGKMLNPALVVEAALAHSDLEVRLVEALPWVLATFYELDWAWLVAQCRLVNAQNRLGYVVSLARQLAQPGARRVLEGVLEKLGRSRLAAEGTLCRESMTEPERNWVRKHRSPEAAHWAILTTLTKEQLTYAA
jgi:transcriptional regulator with XRE-family HTH domain